MEEQPAKTAAPTSRRDALTAIARTGLSLSALTLLAGCATTAGSVRRPIDRQASSTLPDPEWPAPQKIHIAPERRGIQVREPVARAPVQPRTPALPKGVQLRSDWAEGNPIPRRMDRMTTIRRITVHHDGMDTFTSTNSSATRARLEAIRKSHLGREFGDIGYHFAIDPGGRIWQGRELRWQGAHVGGQNGGNIGICVLGNYEKQRPTMRQLDTLEGCIAELMREHDVTLGEVRTHREMASTSCPGRYLQPRLVAMRDGAGALARV